MIARLFTRHATAALVALCALGFAGPAPAQTQNPSPNSMLIAKQIVQIKGVKTMFEPLVRGVVEKARQALTQTNFMWTKDINEVANVVYKDYESRTNDLIDATARIYASHFTEAELKGILTFYQSALGQKILTEEPKALDESMANAGKFGDALYEEVMVKMRVEMKKRGHDL